MKYQTLICSPHTGILHGSSELWRDAWTAFDTRPERFTPLTSEECEDVHARFGNMVPQYPGEWTDTRYLIHGPARGRITPRERIPHIPR